jgi:hypothetical protein
MLYSEHITFPYGQTENTATRRYFKVNRDVIHTIWIAFPPGCAGLVKIKIYHEGHPFVPSQKTEYIIGDNYTFQIPVFYEILGAPEQITVEGWNEDDTFNHTISFYFLILNKKYLMPAGAYEGIIKSLGSIFQRTR